MTEEQLRETASQLRQPHGEGAIAIAGFMNKGNARMNEDALRVLSASPGDNILEVGMGNGYFVKDILQADDSIHYTGADFSAEMVLAAEKWNADWIHKGKAVFVHASAESLPLDNELFHKILTVNTLYFWDDRERVLSEFRRVLKPGGRLYIAIRPERRMVHYPFTKYGFRLYSAEDVRDLLAANGFDEEHTHEHREPDYEVNGERIPVENLVVVAVKR